MAIGAALACAATPRASAQEPEATRNLDAANAVAAWLDHTAVRTEHGVAWPVTPARPDDIRADLYHGSAGVVLSSQTATAILATSR